MGRGRRGHERLGAAACGCGGRRLERGARAACKAPEAAEGRRPASAKGEGKVNIIAWAGYAEDGSTDPKVDWVTPFEKETGCQVNVKIGNTSDEMVHADAHRPATTACRPRATRRCA